jgi:hypothetical protein
MIPIPREVEPLVAEHVHERLVAPEWEVKLLGIRRAVSQNRVEHAQAGLNPKQNIEGEFTTKP